jgi:hypothetical protein
MTNNRQALGILVALALAGCSAPAEDASGEGLDTEAVRSFLVEGLEINKQMDIDFARAIPDSAMRWAPNDDVRDFAEQIVHIANNYWVADGYGMPAPAFADSTVLNDKVALVEAVTVAYDWVIDQVRQLPAEDFLTVEPFFGQPLARWRSYMQVIEHATWTRGQLVPYFHAHGVSVPTVTFF